jgi:hypothetical protein
MPAVSDPVDQRPGQRPASETMDLARARSLSGLSAGRLALGGGKRVWYKYAGG